MERNIMAYLQWVRESDPRSYGLGGIGGEVHRLFELSDDDMVSMNMAPHTEEVKRMLGILTGLGTSYKKSRTS
jgi:hypothetical protein